MKRAFHREILIKLIFVLTLFLLLFSFTSLRAATSPDAIAFRVLPNSNHLSPLRWYQENIKVKGSPQALTVDGYEAVRDGRTVYVNAANIDLNKKHCSNNQSQTCTKDSDCFSAQPSLPPPPSAFNFRSTLALVFAIRPALATETPPNPTGITCIPNFYSNIYVISYNQAAEDATVDIFGQILAHWKFNTNITGSDQKARIIRDTKRLADLADIKSALANYKTGHSGDYPTLAAGSYMASTSISVWPSWRATLGTTLGITLPLDPINKLGACPGYDATTCWNQSTKKFADPVPTNNEFNLTADSHAYVYLYNGSKSYRLCAIMESGYLTTLDQGACPGSAVGHAANCTDVNWIPKYSPVNVCSTQTIIETSNCGRTRNILHGTKEPNNCAATTCLGQKCDNGCAIVDGQLTGPTCCVPDKPSCTAANTCVGQTCNNGCADISGTKCCVTCNEANQPNCRAGASAPGNTVGGSGACCGAGESCYRCADNYKWNGTRCVADTRTFSCAAKPAAGTSWNTASSYTQTWSGSAWLPADSVTEYNTVTSATSCRYECANNYHYDSTSASCVADFCGDGIINRGEKCDKGLPPEICSGAATGLPSYCSGFNVQGENKCNDNCSAWEGCVIQPEIITKTSTNCDYKDAPLSNYSCCELLSCSQDGCGCCGNAPAKAVIPSGYTEIINAANPGVNNVTWDPGMNGSGYWWCYTGAPCLTLGKSVISKDCQGGSLNGQACTTNSFCDPGSGVCNAAGKCQGGSLNGQACTTNSFCDPGSGVCRDKVYCVNFRQYDRTNRSCDECTDKIDYTPSWNANVCKLSQDLRSAGNPKNWYISTYHSTASYRCWK